MESSICTRKGSQTASSSSPASSASSSSSTPIWKHEVFLSFHGPDTRLSFTDHLYDALKQKGILTFRDDEKLERGKDISQELFKAIQESLYAIVILSPNYATSKWCLKELAEIVKCKTQTKLGILPIFCDVDPSDVRKQTGTYKKAFDKHAKNPETESWRAALTEVGNIAGWDLRNRHQATVIQQIVGDIFEKLSLGISSVHGELVGIDSRVMEMMNFIGMGLNDVRFIGIHGMGGVGKTTLSEVIYNSFSHQFEGSSYLASVRESSGNQDLVCLQQKLLCQILKESEFNVGTVSKGATMIRNRMQHQKILIVLDDVSTDSQLEALARSHDWFGLGSRIIITSRDSHLLKRHGVTYLYEIDVLNNDEALKLFSLSAFKKVHPDENYMDLSKSFIKYAKGLPLALKVLGSSLFGRTTNAWKSALNQLKENPMKKILVVLEIGFDGPEDLQKKLFLDIAFFFKCEKLNGVVRETLESSGYYPDINIEVLKDKSLITVLHFGTLEMHDLLQEMGKEIVRHESPIEPGQRSRLCNHEDVLHVLKNNTGTNAVEGIVLKLPPNKLERLSIGGFSKMKKLRILKVDSIIPVENLWDKLCARIGLRHPLKSIPTTELRILEWDGYPLKSLPTNFQADKLVELNFKNSLKIKELWRGRKSFGSLKRLNMEWCTNLIKTPDFTEIQNLEILNLSGCFHLSHIQSIGVLKRLKELKLIKCESVTNLPFDMTGLESLDALDLGGCAKLEQIPKIGCTLRSILSLDGCIRLKKLPDLSGLEFLHKFDASDTAITNFPSPSLLPKKWREFRISGCSDRQAGKFLWFNMSTLSFNNGFHWATKTNGRIYHGGSVIECERNFLEGLYLKYDREYDHNMLYFGLNWGVHKQGLRFETGRGIFDFIMTGASLETSSSRCSEWFNNTTTTAVDIIDYEFIPRMNHPKLKGCSLFFVFEYHGPVIHSQFQTKPPFQPQLFAHDRYLPFGTRTPLMPFACIFERDEGIPSEPLFLWAPVILGIGPIEFWAFVPATRFLEFLRWRTCSSCIGASVVPLKKHRFFDNYYFPSKETKGEISLKEWEDPHGTCWDVIDGDLWKDPFVDVKDCRVRLVYKDDVSQFYSTVAPHALHSKYYEHPCYHPSRNG